MNLIHLIQSMRLDFDDAQDLSVIIGELGMHGMFPKDEEHIESPPCDMRNDGGRLDSVLSINESVC